MLPLAAAITIVATPAIAQEEAAEDIDGPVEIVYVSAVDAVADAADAVAEAAMADTKPIYPREPHLRTYRILKPVDYPIEAWRNDEEGAVQYSVDVDAEGKATSCEVTKSSGSAILDAATCPIVMTRAEFRPAMAERDQPVVGSYSGYLHWRKREPEMPQMSLILRYHQDAQGNTTNCEFLKMENMPEGMRKDIERGLERGRACPGAKPEGRGVPYRDKDGNPVAKIVTATLDVKLEDPSEIPKPVANPVE